MMLTWLTGWWSHNAAGQMDAPGECHVQEVYSGVRCVEFWSGAMGSVHLRQTAFL